MFFNRSKEAVKMKELNGPEDDKQFLEFITKHGDPEKLASEDEAERGEQYEAWKTSAEVGEKVVDLYAHELGGAMGIELDEKAKKSIQTHLEKFVMTPEGRDQLRELSLKTARFDRTSEELRSLTGVLGERMGGEREGSLQGKFEEVTEYQKAVETLRKGAKDPNGLKRLMIGFGFGDEKTREARKLLSSKVKGSWRTNFSNMDLLDDMRAEFKAQGRGLNKYSELRSSIIEDLVANKAMAELVKESVKKRMSKVLAEGDGFDTLKTAQGYFEQVNAFQTQSGETLFTPDEQDKVVGALIEAAASKRIEKFTSGFIVTDGARTELEQELMPLLAIDKMGAKEGDAARLAIAETLRTAARGLKDNQDGKIKKFLLFSLAKKMQEDPGYMSQAA